LDRAGIYTRGTPLSEHEARTFGRLLCLRCEGTPVQHLTGRADFFGFTVEVGPGALIPRPETEVVAQTAIEAAHDPAVIVDLGTGSGVLAIALARAITQARVIATDRSSEALAIAARNVAALAPQVELREGDLF